MTWLWITGGILLFLFLLGLVRAEAVISYAEEFGLTVRIAGIPIRLFPKREKKVRISRYTPRAIARRKRKEERKAARKAKKAAKKKSAAEKKKEKDKKKSPSGKKDIAKIIKLVTSVAKTALRRFGKHLRIRIARLHVGVATGDAAETAVLYGAVSQSVAYLAELLDSTSTLRHPAKSDVRIWADYLSEKPVLDIEIGLSLCVWQVLDLVFRSAASAIKALAKS